jgi:hypothetical protein
MKPLGQIQAAERTIHSNNYSATMAKALLRINCLEPSLQSRALLGQSWKHTCLQGLALFLEVVESRIYKDTKRALYALHGCESW